MPVKTVLLLTSGVVVLAAIAYLFLEVRSAPAAVSSKKIEEARERSTHADKARATAPSSANLDDPWAKTRVEPSSRAAEDLDLRPGAGVSIPAPLSDSPDVVEPIAEQAPEYRPATAKEASTPSLDGDPKLELSNAKDEANRQYDKQDFEGSLATAVKILEREPGDVRMLRVAVSSACQLGDAEKAKAYYAQLPPHDQSQMARRCQRMNITFE